jgi:hypothetical protein
MPGEPSTIASPQAMRVSEILAALGINSLVDPRAPNLIRSNVEVARIKLVALLIEQTYKSGFDDGYKMAMSDHII